MSATTTSSSSEFSDVQRPTWIVSDMDGTFLDDHHNLSQTNVDAYYALRKAGAPVIPATGRSYHALRTVLEAKQPTLEFKYFPGLYCNGSVAYGASQDELLYHAKLGAAVIRAVAAAAYRWFDLDLKVHSDTCMTLFLQHVEGALVDFRTPFYEKFETEWYEEPSVCLNKRIDEEVIARPLKYNQTTIFVSESRTQDLLNYLRNDAECKQLIESGEMRCFNSTVMEINCLGSDDDKAKGIELLIKRFGYERTGLMTLGDGNNDLGMLRLAPFSVAMGQAKDAVKKSAKYVTAPTDKHGWAEAVSKLILSN